MGKILLFIGWCLGVVTCEITHDIFEWMNRSEG